MIPMPTSLLTATKGPCVCLIAVTSASIAASTSRSARMTLLSHNLGQSTSNTRVLPERPPPTGKVMISHVIGLDSKFCYA